MPELLSVGLIGCGWIAELAHLDALRRSGIARLVVVAEPDAARRATIQRRLPGVRLLEHGAELLADPAVEAVLIAVPTAAAAEIARSAFAAGKHTYVEKPGARSTTEWRAVVDTWSGSGTTGVIGYNFRHNPIALDAARRLRAGAIGRVIAVQARFLWAADRIEGWRAAVGTGGGVLLDLASHHVDLITHLLDDTVSGVRCTTRSRRVEEDTADLCLELQGGATAQVLVSSAAGAHANRLTVVGSEGVLEIDLLDARPAPVQRRPGRLERVRRAGAALQALHPARLLRPPGREPSFESALGEFLAGARHGVPVRPDPADALRVLEVIDAARVSARAAGSHVALGVGAT